MNLFKHIDRTILVIVTENSTKIYKDQKLSSKDNSFNFGSFSSSSESKLFSALKCFVDNSFLKKTNFQKNSFQIVYSLSQ